MSATLSDTGPIPAAAEVPTLVDMPMLTALRAPAHTTPAHTTPARPAPGAPARKSRPKVIALDPIRLTIMVFVVSVHTLAFGGG